MGNELSRLETLAEIVVRERVKAIIDASAAIQHTIKAGDALIEAKVGLKHGEWEAWVNDRCGLTPRTARRWMALSKSYSQGNLDLDGTAKGSLTQLPQLSELVISSDNITPSAIEKVKRPQMADLDSPPNQAVSKSAKPSGKPVTGERVKQAIADGKELYSSIMSDIQRVRRDVKRLSGDVLGTHISLQRTDAGLVNAYQALKFATPFARCPYCAKPKGEQEGCRACRKLGWISRGLHNDAPKELKEMAAKGGSG